MPHSSPWVIVALLSLASCRGAAPQSARDVFAEARFARLTTLSGNWVTVQEPGTQPAGQRVRYELTARGTALVETLFAGTLNEMVSVYSVVDGELEPTHYCSLGNQPRMRAVRGDAKERIVFEFSGGANLDPERDTHMHRVEFELVDETHLRAAWTVYERGRAAEVVSLALARTWNTP